jgi:hypothetical protein
MIILCGFVPLWLLNDIPFSHEDAKTLSNYSLWLRAFVAADLIALSDYSLRLDAFVAAD